MWKIIKNYFNEYFWLDVIKLGNILSYLQNILGRTLLLLLLLLLYVGLYMCGWNTLNCNKIMYTVHAVMYSYTGYIPRTVQYTWFVPCTVGYTGYTWCTVQYTFGYCEGIVGRYTSWLVGRGGRGGIAKGCCCRGGMVGQTGGYRGGSAGQGGRQLVGGNLVHPDTGSYATNHTERK